MTTKIKTALIVFIIGILVIVGIVIAKIYPGVKPVITNPPQDFGAMFEEQSKAFPLVLSDHVEISLFAKNVSGARVLAFGPDGELWVSQPKQGEVSRIDGAAQKMYGGYGNLNQPHGILFDQTDPTLLYIAEENKIVHTRVGTKEAVVTLVDLPKGGRHTTRSLAWGPQDELLVSIGSSCDVCNEKNPLHGTIQKVNLKKKTLEPYATGLRNSVFMATHPGTKEVWATEMGRDFLGDTLPPDEVNIIHENKDYGWPYFYGKNIRDQKFEPEVSVRREVTPSTIDLPAHVAPLGLAFIPPNSEWPESWWYDVVLAFHGSWNSSHPVGYKVVRVPLDETGGFTKDGGTHRVDETVPQEPVFVDMVRGFLTADNRALGRPVGILIRENGTMLVSDDHAGAIYQVRYIQKETPPTNKEPETCVMSGCNGEVCDEEEKASACVYKDAFACYKDATCTRGGDGKCAWQKTPELMACLKEFGL